LIDGKAADPALLPYTPHHLAVLAVPAVD